MKTALRKVLVPSADVTEVSLTATYPMAGMLNRGRGLFRKEDVAGHETSYRKLTRLREGQLVYSRLFAWEGAIAVVSRDFEGVFVSPEFPAFDLDASRVLPSFLAHVARWSEFHLDVAGGRKGLGLRRQRVSPEALLDVEIPLPDIDEQRRIAEHLDGVATETSGIVQRRGVLRPRAEALAASLATQPQLDEARKRDLGWKRLPLKTVMEKSSDAVGVELDEKYPNLGIYSFGRGVFEKPPIDGLQTSAKKLNRVRAGQFIYSRLFAFEGAYAFVPEDFDGVFVSNEFPSFDVDPEITTADFIAAALRNPEAWRDLAGSSKGLGLRRQRIKVDALLDHELWCPPIGEQQRVAGALRQLARLNALIGESDALAAAVFPAALNRVFAALA